jgi:hypothetical protein
MACTPLEGAGETRVSGSVFLLFAEPFAGAPSGAIAGALRFLPGVLSMFCPARRQLPYVPT